MPTYTLQYTTTNIPADDNGRWLATVNDATTDIFNRYVTDGKITDSTITESSGTYTQVLTFDTVTSYNEWYAEIDAIDTTPPSGMTYIGEGVYAD
jgi:hypothetical protein